MLLVSYKFNFVLTNYSKKLYASKHLGIAIKLNVLEVESVSALGRLLPVSVLYCDKTLL